MSRAGWLNWGRFDHTRGINSHFTLTDLYYALHKFANYTQDTMLPNYIKYTLYRVAQKISTTSANKDVNGVLCELFWLLMVSWNASSCFDTIEAKNTENTKKVRGTNATKWLGAAGAPPIYSTLSSQLAAPLIHPHPRTHGFVYFHIFVFLYFCIFVNTI